MAEARGIDLRFIQPGKPQQNGYVERWGIWGHVPNLLSAIVMRNG